MDISRAFKIVQSSNAGETLAPGRREVLDPVGTYITYTVTFRRKKGREAEFDKLWDEVITPRYDGVPVEIVYNQTTIKYDAKFISGSQPLKKIDPLTKVVYWEDLKLNIEPVQAQVLPE
jgi:hypothetical protein